MTYVAVVGRPDGNTISARERGDFSAFIGDNKDEVIKRALEAARSWSGMQHCDGSHLPAKYVQYTVLVGELTQQADYSIYKLEDLK